MAPAPKRQVNAQAPATAAATTEIESLKGEIQRLQSILSGFTQVPQSFQQAASNTPVHAATYPGAEYGLSYDFSSIFQKLVETGVSAELAAEVGVNKEALRVCLLKGVQRGYFTRHEPLNGRGFRYSVELGDKVPMGLTYGEVIGASGGTA